MESKVEIVGEFRPVKVTFTLETQGELDAFGSLFNSAVILDAIRRIAGKETSCSTLYKALKDAGANIDLTDQFPRYFDK